MAASLLYLQRHDCLRYREVVMQVMVERCCGLDVHQESVVACLLIGAPGVRPTREVRTFSTMTRDLEAFRDWLKAAGVTHVGMEVPGSTGVLSIRCWKGILS